MFNQRAGYISSLFDNASIAYDKGGAVIHTLREQVGNGAFWRGINIYLQRHRFASVESADRKRAMEEASGQDLAWFFDQWVYGVGSPKLDIRQTYNKRTQILTLTIRQTQVAGSLTPRAFQLPLDVTIKTNGKEIGLNRRHVRP